MTGGYEITDRGRWFYREHYAAHADVRAPHPDGGDAEPWPPRLTRSSPGTLLTAPCARNGKTSGDACLAAETESPPPPGQSCRSSCPPRRPGRPRGGRGPSWIRGSPAVSPATRDTLATTGRLRSTNMTYHHVAGPCPAGPDASCVWSMIRVPAALQGVHTRTITSRRRTNSGGTDSGSDSTDREGQYDPAWSADVGSSECDGSSPDDPVSSGEQRLSAGDSSEIRHRVVRRRTLSP